MASLPVPRSFPQIYGDLVDTFRSRFGIPQIKPGSPLDALFHSAAQSDLRSSQDVFQLLAAINLDQAEGDSLDRIGADEDVARLTDSPASGLVNIIDSSFVKQSTKVYQGQPAPIVGSSTIYVADATNFPASGSIYIGRGTTNYEGSLAYISKSNLGTFWSLTLSPSSKTTKFHNLGESVVLAQGGDRVVAAGTIVQTPQGNVRDAIKFSTLYSVTIPDGETEVDSVTVVAQQPGIIGNVTSGAINQFITKPFNGAQVTNPLPFTNAQATWNDKTYREAIKNARQSRAKGTSLAIKTAVLGVTSPDENKRVASASVVVRTNAPTTLYIDDGTGYEEISEGVPLETLTELALGGEQFFQVSASRPVTKAYLVTTIGAPFALTAGSKLAVVVAGLPSKHTFDSSQFSNISNATAYEVVASINSNPDLTFSARTIGNGTQVAIFAKSEADESVQVTGVNTGETDANSVLGFPAGRVDTMRLYRNDRLLSKDGQQASIESEPQSGWASMSQPQTLSISVDGTPVVTYLFTDSDFINAGTGYGTLSNTNSLDAWATVFNTKVPGITATASGGRLIISSNVGADARSQVIITGGSLVTSGRMFVFNTNTGLESTGSGNDYTLNRNTGQIELTKPLASGDRLTLGSTNTRAFIESADLPVTTLSGTGQLWFAIDGQAEVISTGLGSSTVINISEYVTTPGVTWGHRVRVTAASGSPFVNVQEGDWAILLDTNFSSQNQGAWRVDYVDPNRTYFEFSRSAVNAQSGVSMNAGGIVFVRTLTQLQVVSVPAASNYTAATVVDQINSQLIGATAYTYRTKRVRVRTNSFGAVGDLALVAANTEAKKLLLPISSANINLSSHMASVESANAESGTPGFVNTTLASVASSSQFNLTTAIGDLSSFLVFDRDLPDTDNAVARDRYGNNTGYQTAISAISGSTYTVRQPALEEYLPADRVHAQSPYALSAQDDLTVVVDQDAVSKRYAMNLYRRVKPTSSNYSSTNSFTDSDNGNQSLAVAFGLSFNWADYEAWMHARVKTHSGPDTTKTILWRYSRYGPDGNVAVLRYVYPTAPSQAVAVTNDPVTLPANQLISIRLPSGAARNGYQVHNSSKVGVMAATSGSLQTLTYILGFAVSSASRVVKIDYTGRGTTAFSGTVTGGTSGATATVSADSLAGGLSGAGTLTLTAIVGTFVPGETLTGTTGSATAGTTQYGYTTLTLDIATPGCTGHGLIVGNQVWLQSTSGSFTSGLKTLAAVTGSTVSYQDTATAVGATANIGELSNDSQDAYFTGVQANDIVSWGPTAGVPSGYQRSVRVATLGTQYLSGPAETALSTGTVPTWYTLGDATAFAAFPIDSSNNQASQIASAVNTLAAVVNSTCPVTAVAVGSGGVSTGQISLASFDELSTAGYTYSLSDGVNWILSNTQPASTSQNYSFTFKNGVSASLASNSDWQNAEVRLVPKTAQNIADFLNVPAVSGLSTVAEISVVRS